MIDYKKIITSNYTPITPYHMLLELDSGKLYTQFEPISLNRKEDKELSQTQVLNFLKERNFEILPIYYYMTEDEEKQNNYSSYVYDTTEIIISNIYDSDKVSDIRCSGRMSYLALNKDKLICLRVNSYTVSGVFYASKDNIQFLDELYSKFKADDKKNKTTYKIGIAYSSSGGLNVTTKHVPIATTISQLDMNKNYNDDFDYNKIYNLVERDGKGLMILHGTPGTGKTTFIKHLMYKYETKRNFIYLPASLAQSIDSPGLTRFFLDYGENAVFIIEDAEALVASRSSGNTGLSGFLNASDGILSDLLCAKFIVTFNTDINASSVDSALLRKGRLDYIYKFGPLSKEKASAFLNKEVDKPYSLTDLFNWEENNNKQSINNTTRIGF